MQGRIQEPSCGIWGGERGHESIRLFVVCTNTCWTKIQSKSLRSAVLGQAKLLPAFQNMNHSFSVPLKPIQLIWEYIPAATCPARFSFELDL